MIQFLCKSNKAEKISGTDKSKNKGRSNLALFCVSFFILSFCLALSGCGKRVVLTSGFGKDEVFLIGEEKCTRSEIMVYLCNIQNRYESVYGAGIWDARLGGVTLESNVRDTVLAQIAQVKSMYLLAINKGVELTSQQEALVKKAAQEYFSSLSQEEIEYLGITLEKIEKMYREYALADSVYEVLIADINPEISDDEARNVVVQRIFISTCEADGLGGYVQVGQEKKAEIYNTAMELQKRAAEGEDFVALAQEYSSDEVLELTLGRNDVDAATEKAVFSLAKGEISTIVESEAGLNIYKCISTLDREQTEANKLLLVEQRRQAAFEEEYNSFVEGLIKKLNDELWSEITLNHDFIIEADFFGIYDLVFDE